jgi:hypothetical protein
VTIHINNQPVKIAAASQTGSNTIEIAVTITRETSLIELLALSAKNASSVAFTQPTLNDCLSLFNWQEYSDQLPCLSQSISRVYFGGEFCDRLIPDVATMKRVLTLLNDSGLKLSLITPLVSDKGLSRLSQTFQLLPNDTEVIVNDWGVLRVLRSEYPKLVPVIGRQLCKMIKDPRLPSAQWAQLYPHGVQSGPFHHLLARFDIQRLEMDVPPFATSNDFESPQHDLSVHLPYGFSVKGRMCKIGATAIEGPKKFGPGHSCNKECLSYVTKASRPQMDIATNAAVNPALKHEDLATFQQGNTMFYRHNKAMSTVLAHAVAENKVSRLIYEGDWHENYRTH